MYGMFEILSLRYRNTLRMSVATGYKSGQQTMGLRNTQTGTQTQTDTLKLCN